MAGGVPSTNEILLSSLEANFQQTKLYLPGLLPGTFYVAYASGTSYASSAAATSIFNGMSTSTYGTRSLPANFFVRQDTKTLSSANRAAGGMIHGTFMGTIATTGTPTLMVTVGLTNGSTYTSFSSTGVDTLVTISVTSNFTLDFFMVCEILGQAGTASIWAGGNFFYYAGASGITLTALPLVNTVTTATLDTTVPLTVDAQWTWGTSSSSNALINQVGYIEYRS